MRTIGGMKRLQVVFSDRRIRRITWLMLTLILVACQENDGGGGGVDPGY